jgi:RNA polymerase sigma-70 factor (ECF subfamily)
MDNSQKTDNQLVQMALENRNDFSLLIERYSPKLQRYILRLGKISNDDCQDILQDVFIKVYKNLNDYDSDLKFSSWIYRIAHNQVIDFFRKNNVRPHVLVSNEDYDFFDIIGESFDLISDAQRDFDKQRVLACINKLEEKYKEVLMLRFLEQKDYKEISDILEKPEGTIATLINRAKKQFKTVYNQ